MGKANPLSGYGLDWLSSKREKAAFDKFGLACVYAAGPSDGGPARISWTSSLQRRLDELQLASWKKIVVHDVIWLAGPPLARRVETRAHEILTKAGTLIRSDWFDVPALNIGSTLRIAAVGIGLKYMDHDEMLSSIREAAEEQIRRAVAAA